MARSSALVSAVLAGVIGAGRIAPEVVAAEGRAVVRRRLPLSLTFDHRVVSGGEATRFLAALIADLGQDD
ncbi:MAG: 2-oxo acid dehydrogenase subunit E2 [Rhodospirillales bacterium]|nr:2-oxo acid dehydrogenase subunit E2 [Rhodospirillales bacterium]MDP6805418.1 2-oxo acid dehydrogenase subunit E2 [Rhodospirillales bacterium]